jgi:hypothetical protein
MKDNERRKKRLEQETNEETKIRQMKETESLS